MKQLPPHLQKLVDEFNINPGKLAGLYRAIHENVKDVTYTVEEIDCSELFGEQK